MVIHVEDHTGVAAPEPELRSGELPDEARRRRREGASGAGRGWGVACASALEREPVGGGRIGLEFPSKIILITYHNGSRSLPAHPHLRRFPHSQTIQPTAHTHCSIAGIALQGYAPSLFTPTSRRYADRGSRTAPTHTYPTDPNPDEPTTVKLRHGRVLAITAALTPPPPPPPPP